MIDGRELRFGNLFYWSDPEMDEVKGHKTIGTVWKHNIGDGEFMDAIPLTEEWLLKLGATSNEPMTPFFIVKMPRNIGEIHVNPMNHMTWLRHWSQETAVMNPNSLVFCSSASELIFLPYRRRIGG